VGDPGGVLGVGVGAAEPGVGEQRLDFSVPGDQPGHVPAGVRTGVIGALACRVR
jgi:hypothetical protein